MYATPVKLVDGEWMTHSDVLGVGGTGRGRARADDSSLESLEAKRQRTESPEERQATSDVEIPDTLDEVLREIYSEVELDAMIDAMPNRTFEEILSDIQSRDILSSRIPIDESVGSLGQIENLTDEQRINIILRDHGEQLGSAMDILTRVDIPEPLSPQTGPSGVQVQQAQGISPQHTPRMIAVMPYRGSLVRLRNDIKEMTDAQRALFRTSISATTIRSSDIMVSPERQAGCAGLALEVASMTDRLIYAKRKSKLALTHQDMTLLPGALTVRRLYNNQQTRSIIINEISNFQGVGKWSDFRIVGYERYRGNLQISTGAELVTDLEMAFNPLYERGRSATNILIGYAIHYADLDPEIARVGHIGGVRRAFVNDNYLNDIYSYYDSSWGVYLYGNFNSMAYALDNYFHYGYDGVVRAHTSYFVKEQ